MRELEIDASERTVWQIRSAREMDAKSAVPLVMAAIGSIAFTLSGTTDEEDTRGILENFFVSAGNRICYQNMLCAVDASGEVVGVLICYRGKDSFMLDAPFIDYQQRLQGKTLVKIDREPGDDEYYLDTISVSPSVQSQGAGRALMEAFEQRARQRQEHKLSLLVDAENLRTKAWYERLGYRRDEDKVISGYFMHHMVKLLE